MNIKSKAMGDYQTNCYIVTIDGKDLIIDAGIGATSWVLENVKNPVAILNTHGHFDHVWSNKELKEKLNIPIYIEKRDAFMLENDPFGKGTPSSKADILIDGDTLIDIDGISVKYRHFAGHTPGNSIIEIGDVWFCGDFLFERSIGRWDFPYSNAEEMYNSLLKAKGIKEDFTLYTGHGSSTTLKNEQRYIDFWLKEVGNSI
ncbi:Hydroxyacylglutathione hydrolase [hydrothermal vent metagenome]|uniref:Hydroxyacylglutathione hydrolase n=1 Tax=hydrothermal vent metagenome TaxID=652676 RepID=A0A1W1EKF3_9ZZZZ